MKAYKLAVESLEKMRLKDIEEVLKKYPHELSGGMLQRIMIAVAIALNYLLKFVSTPKSCVTNKRETFNSFF